MGAMADREQQGPTPYGTGRERLLVATRELLIANGGDLDVEDVAAHADVSKSLIWRHFGNRSGLLVAVMEDFWNSYDEAVADIHSMPNADWPTREHERLRRTVDFLLEHPLAPVVLGHLEGDLAVHRSGQERLERRIDAAATNIRRGQDAGEISQTIDADLMAATIVGGLHQALIQALTAPRAPNRKHLTKTLWQAVAAMLRLPRQEKLGHGAAAT
jgi:AcrR family transcriptional regulator